MLSVKFTETEETVKFIDDFFDTDFMNEWLEDQFVKDMINVK